MLGFSLGPLVGGALTHVLSWRSVFGCTAAALIAAAIGLLTARAEEAPATPRPSHIDAGGFLTRDGKWHRLITGAIPFQAGDAAR